MTKRMNAPLNLAPLNLAIAALISFALFSLVLMPPVISKALTEERVALEEVEAIQDTITRQIDAFARDDGDAAFAFASPTIQSIFSDPPTFMSMVRRGYPMIYRPQAFSFLETRHRDGVTAQAVQFIDFNGKGTIALYVMERQEDGTWRINGVTLVQQGGLES